MVLDPGIASPIKGLCHTPHQYYRRLEQTQASSGDHYKSCCGSASENRVQKLQYHGTAFHPVMPRPRPFQLGLFHVPNALHVPTPEDCPALPVRPRVTPASLQARTWTHYGTQQKDVTRTTPDMENPRTNSRTPSLDRHSCSLPDRAYFHHARKKKNERKPRKKENYKRSRFDHETKKR